MINQLNHSPIFREDLHKIVDETMTIFRYIPFKRFKQLINDKALYFRRSDKLPDRFEGSNAKYNLQNSPELSQLEKNWKKCFYLNCWSMDEHPDYLMWSTYIRDCDNEGIAIKSTIKHLYDSLKCQKDICFGRVKYLDYNTCRIPKFFDCSLILHKDIIYRTEKELRLIFQYCYSITGENSVSIFDNNPDGISKQVDLDILIDEIYINPNSKNDFDDKITSFLCENKLGKKIKPLNRCPLI